MRSPTQRVYDILPEEAISTTKVQIPKLIIPCTESRALLCFLLEMITLPYSSSPFSTCFLRTKTCLSKPKFSTKRFLSHIGNNDSATKPSNFVPFVIKQTQDDDDKNNNLKRREAVGLGFGFGLCNVMLHSLPEATSAAESAAAPCELTMAASGIAFCDKVVGYGPRAEKGQLIKVIINIVPLGFIMKYSKIEMTRFQFWVGTLCWEIGEWENFRQQLSSWQASYISCWRWGGTCCKSCVLFVDDNNRVNSCFAFLS